MRITSCLTMLLAAVLLTACGGKEQVKEPGAGTPSTQQGETTGVGEGGAGRGEELPGGQQVEDPRQQQRVIYFDFDSYEIPAQYRDIVAAHARVLANDPSAKVRLEGHTDERGSREYNIGLGERRAQAVRRALMLLGAGDSQLVTVSYGEERPAVAGSDESAWAKNRRVEIVYSN